MPASKRPVQARRIRGLDSIRVVCAIWVVFGHFGFLPGLLDFDPGTVHGKILRGIMGNLFSGPPAVIVFFVISGFCIHYPFREAGVIPGWRYLLRRYIRIGIPALAAASFAHTFAPGNPAFDISAKTGTVVWSLMAEVVYYTIYPFLFIAAARWGWLRLLATAVIFSLVIIVRAPSLSYLPSYGPWLTWIVGLPYWLLGCHLADSLDRNPGTNVMPSTIWKWRLSVWAGASLASVLMFHAGVGYPWTMLVFGPAIYFWLRNEISYYRTRTPWAVLEWAGLWSYSIYAMHLVLPDLIRKLPLNWFGPGMKWGLLVILVLIGCYLFYLLVEKPSHWLGRQIQSRTLMPASPAPIRSEA